MDTTKKNFARIDKLFMIESVHLKEPSSMPIHHYHDAYEIFYLVRGERNYFIKDKIYPVTKGTLVFINMDELHRTTISSLPEYERILINFKSPFIGEFISGVSVDLLQCFRHNTNAIKLNISEQAYVENLLNHMLNEERKKNYGYDVSLRAMLLELLLFITRHIHNNPEDEFHNQNPIHTKVSNIVSYINTNYQEPISLETLSKAFFISPCYLSRIFKEATGFNFTEYLNNVRILESKKLLKNSSTSITRIAENVGYENATHFGRMFKLLEGISPLKYRQKN